ncbi:Phosphoglycerate mutase [Parafrankia sp. Ea1.12]|nr:Phosphoglycerate mutase [Parafrankia sp. Ea1.12]
MTSEAVTSEPVGQGPVGREQVTSEPAGPVVVPAGRVTLIRHGETEWSRTGRHTGHTDVPLTAEGERQAAALRAALVGRRFVLVATSPRRRAAHTAEIAGLCPPAGEPGTIKPGTIRTQAAGTPAALSDTAGAQAAAPGAEDCVVWPELAEWDYGDYEGVTTARIREDHPGWTVFTGDVPGGETADEVGRRADLVLGRVVPLLAHGDVALLGHGHMLRVLVARWLGLPPTAGAHFVIEPAGVSELGFEHENRVLRQLNARPAPPTRY